MLQRLRAFPGILWGLGGGLIASLCWFGPVLAVLLGISGASFLFAALNGWYYYILGALFLAVGIYFQRRRQPVTGSLASQRRNRWLFPIVTVTSGGVAYVLITFILVPLLVSLDTRPAPLPQAELSVDEIPYAKPASLRQAELRVEGMTWYSCAIDIERAAGLQPGVNYMEVHYPEGDAVLVYDGNQTTPERVVQALHDILPDVEIFIETDRPLP